MISFVLFVYLLYLFFLKDNRKKRTLLFICTIVITIFLFSSKDPIIKLPLYIYPLLLSVLFSLKRSFPKKLFMSFCILSLVLIIGICLLGIGIHNQGYLLLKQSNTDTWTDISQQLFIPTINFTVLKHFIFFFIYMLFILCNYDICIDKEVVDKTISILNFSFHVLFIGIIIEWLLVNVLKLSGEIDRSIMSYLFSIIDVNQTTDWLTWGSYSVAFCFTERSEIGVIIIYYLIQLKQKNPSYFWILISFFTVYCTGSSTGLSCTVLFITIYTIIQFVEYNNVNLKWILFFIIILILIFILSKNNLELFSKVNAFISDNGGVGSASFRARSLDYAKIAITSSPLFGIGIGTIYCHSMLLQTIANIGILGFIATLFFHYHICPFKFNMINTMEIITIFYVSYGAFMIENFTSPFILTLFLILSWKETNCYGVTNK